MLFTDTELENAPALEEYEHEPTRLETLKASFTNFRSVNLSHSKDNHYKDIMGEESAEWAKRDPLNAELYARVSKYDVRDINKLEALYENNPNSIQGYTQANPVNADIFLVEDFKKMKELQRINQGMKSFKQINDDVLTKANTEYKDTNKILEASDHWGMELLGGAGGALTDVKTLQTLPLGTWKTGGTVLQNAGRAIVEEMGIEALAQTSIAPEVYAFKKELGIKTTILSEAATAATSIVGAGIFRGGASAGWDLSSKGISALKAKDPDLGDDYERLVSTQATEDAQSHVNNLQDEEFGAGATKIENPNEKGEELNNAEPIPEDNPDVIKAATEARIDKPEYSKLEEFTMGFKSAEEFEKEMAETGYGNFSISDIVQHIDKHSKGQLDFDVLRKNLLDGGPTYFKTRVDPKTLKIEDVERVAQENIGREGEIDTPIVVGKDGEVIDGRHRTQRAADEGVEEIEAYIPAKDYYKQVMQKKAALEPKEKLDTDAVSPELLEKAIAGDEQAKADVAGAVFSRTFERVINKNTGDQLKPMILDKLVENPDLVEEIAAKHGFEIKYFSSNPDNVGKKIGKTVIEERPQTRNKLKKQGYQAGKIWVYDPYDVHGSFNDAEYTKAWRGIHELAHALTERMMQSKYGDSRRFGALSFDSKNPYDANDPRLYKALSSEEAQRAIEWEDVAFRAQTQLLEAMGIKINKNQAVNDFNIAGSDTLVRTLTGDFSDPAELGVVPRSDDYRIDVKDALELIGKQEEATAKKQGRKATRGTDLKVWEPISDKEIANTIKESQKSPLKQPTKFDKDTPTTQISIEAVPGEEVDIGLKEIIQGLSPKHQDDYLKEMYKALTDQAGSSLIAKKLGLEIGDFTNLPGVWKGEVNPSAQVQLKSELDANGNLTQAFKDKINDMAEMYAVALKQDGVGWHYPNYKNNDIMQQDGMEITSPKALTKDDIVELEKLLDEVLPNDFIIASTVDGARILKNNEAKIPNDEFQDIIAEALENFSKDVHIESFSAEGNLVKGATDGGTIEKNSLKRQPDLQEWFNDNIIKQVERVNTRFKGIAEYEARPKQQAKEEARLAAEKESEETTFYSGEDEAGNPIYKSHKELADEIDAEAKALKGVEECLIK